MSEPIKLDREDQDLIDYYKYLRQEIVREDNITNQRITWCIAFQGFLINAMALLVVFGWNLDQDYLDIQIFRRMALFAIAILGIVIARSSYFRCVCISPVSTCG